ncbi:MAG: DoxX family membrane protein [Bacteroidota bacterium]|nr:DoxX family membrane protein [Bacteroidota bacterium]
MGLFITKRKDGNYSMSQLSFLVILRVFIGWHFLYEGITKLVNPDWTAYGFLNDSGWIFSGVFHNMANNPGTLNIVDFLNIWGLVLIGFSMILGLLSKPAIMGGIVLLAMYYLSHPPFVGIEYAIPSEGKYLWVNKNLIELAALAVLYVFPTSRKIGLDRFIFRSRN